jgi:hypothetical protein
MRRQSDTTTHPNDDKVQELVDVGPLELCLARILHELRVFASKNHEPVAPLRVAQHATA